jgi:hypothetical protein
MKARLLIVPGALLFAAWTAACGSPTSTAALYETQFDTAGLFALTTAPESGPTAIDVLVLGVGPRAVRAVPGDNFDVAFDLLGTQAIAYPTHAISPASGYAAGIVKSTLAFDAVTVAPTSGYNDSTAIDIQPGNVIVVQSFSAACASQPLVARKYIYAKIIIDSVNLTPYDPITAPAGRTLYYRIVSDPNCGYTSLEPGIPQN